MSASILTGLWLIALLPMCTLVALAAVMVAGAFVCAVFPILFGNRDSTFLAKYVFLLAFASSYAYGVYAWFK